MAKNASTKKSARQPDDCDIAAGALIRERRLELGLSQTDVGNRIGVTFQQLQKYEAGKNRLGASRLQQTAEALDVPVSYFFAATEGQSDETSSILGGPADPSLLRLIKAFNRIKGNQTRQTLVMLAENLAEG